MPVSLTKKQVDGMAVFGTWPMNQQGNIEISYTSKILPGFIPDLTEHLTMDPYPNLGEALKEAAHQWSPEGRIKLNEIVNTTDYDTQSLLQVAHCPDLEELLHQSSIADRFPVFTERNVASGLKEQLTGCHVCVDDKDDREELVHAFGNCLGFADLNLDSPLFRAETSEAIVRAGRNSSDASIMVRYEPRADEPTCFDRALLNATTFNDADYRIAPPSGPPSPISPVASPPPVASPHPTAPPLAANPTSTSNDMILVPAIVASVALMGLCGVVASRKKCQTPAPNAPLETEMAENRPQSTSGQPWVNRLGGVNDISLGV